MRTYSVTYDRGAGSLPWAVYRLVSIGLISSGQVYVKSFATSDEARAFCASRNPVDQGDLDLERERAGRVTGRP